VIKKLELQVKTQEEEVQKRGTEIEKLQTWPQMRRNNLLQLKRENSVRIEELKFKVGEIAGELRKRQMELQASKELLDKKDVDLNRLERKLNTRIGN